MDKVLFYNLHNIDGTIRCVVGLVQEEGGQLLPTAQVAMPNDAAVVGQWLLDQLAADEETA